MPPRFGRISDHRGRFGHECGAAVVSHAKPEKKARRKIDQQLEACNWVVQGYGQMNIPTGLGVAVREFPISTGETDDLVYADAKPEGLLLTGVETQSGKFDMLISMAISNRKKSKAVKQIGSLGRAYKLLGDQFPVILEELNARLAA